MVCVFVFCGMDVGMCSLWVGVLCVVSQDDTFKCPKESLRKRQFTMYQVYTARVGAKAHRWCDMVCRDTCKRISQAEKNLKDNLLQQ